MATAWKRVDGPGFALEIPVEWASAPATPPMIATFAAPAPGNVYLTVARRAVERALAFDELAALADRLLAVQHPGYDVAEEAQMTGEDGAPTLHRVLRASEDDDRSPHFQQLHALSDAALYTLTAAWPGDLAPEAAGDLELTFLQIFASFAPAPPF